MAKLDLAFQLTANANGMAAGVAQADRELGKVGASAKATSAEFRQAAKITAEMRTPAEKYADTVGRLDKMLQKGLLTQEVYGRAVAKADKELKAATSSMDEMAKKATIAERVLNGTSNAIRGVADATKSVADAGVSVIKFGKDVAWTYLQWKVFQTVRSPAGIQEFAVNALSAAMKARTLILAAKALGVGLAIGGGAAGTAAAAVLGLSNPFVGAALLTLNLGRAFLNAKDRALEMASGITEGRTSLEQLNAQLGQVQAQQVDNLAFAMEEATAAGERSKAAFAGLGDVFVTPFVGAFAAIRSGMAGLTDGVSSVVEGITSIASPVAQAIAPIFTLMGTLVEGVLKFIGVMGEAFGIVLKVAGAITNVLLSPIIVGLSNFAEAVRSGMNSVFEWIGQRIDWAQKKLDGFYKFMSKVPVIGRAFASKEAPAQGGGAAAAQADAQPQVAPVQPELIEAARTYYSEITRAAEAAAQFGEAGMEAALAYKTELQNIADLQAEGTYNQEQAARAAQMARKQFDESIATIREATRAEEERAEAARRATEAALEADRRIVESLEKRMQIEEQFGGDQGRAEAAENVLAVQREIARVEAEILEARAAGDEEALKALEERLARLNQIADKEQDIASGAAKAREEAARAEAEAADEAARAAEEAQRKAEQIANQINDKIEQMAKIRGDKARALEGKSNEALKANDVRSSEGMAQYIALATGREDPAIEENRKTNQKLEELRRDLMKILQDNNVEILGAAA